MRIRMTMAPRDPDEAHRVATPLELLLDLTFVVAIAQAASSLHHAISSGHAGHALVAYPMVFFAIWWTWVNMTWFASAYDTDDVLYRLAVFAQMVGVLVLAAGVPRAFDGSDFTVIVVGYVIMRLALVSQWLRAAASDPVGRSTALRYALGITIVQAAWIARIALPDDWATTSFLVLVVAELAIPPWAERTTRTSWHPGHIAERYGLFTIIVLGESVLSATVGAQVALDANTALRDLAAIIVGGLLLVFAMWWDYFDLPNERLVVRARDGFEDHPAGAYIFGYGHYVVLASAAAVGAGLAVAIDHVAEGGSGHAVSSGSALGASVLSDAGAGLAVTVPAALYILAVWGLHFRNTPSGLGRNVVTPVTAGLIVASSFSAQPVLFTGLLVSAMVAIRVVTSDDGPVRA